MHDNSTGINVQGLDGAIYDNEVFANTTGIVAGGAGTIVGHADLTQDLGNLVHNNSSIGIDAAGADVLVVGNTAFGHNGSNAIGILVYTGAVARQNVAFDNYYGIQAGYSSSGSGGVAEENRAYDLSLIHI